MSTSDSSTAVDGLVEQADELCDVHDHITRIIADLDIPPDSFSDQYSHSGQAQFDFEPVIRMFLYQHAREFNDSELTRRLKGTAYVFVRFRLSRPPTQQGINYIWRRRLSLADRRQIKATAHASAGCQRREARITALEPTDDGFVAETETDETLTATYAIAATKNTVGFLEGMDGVEFIERGKTFIETDDRGRSGVPGLYAAGRLALQPYQTIVVAGHGASVGVAVVEDSETDFYHDWVAPKGYFTGRDREVPPGCEEIGPEERQRRECESRELMREYFAEPHPDEPIQHPNVREE